MVVFTHARVALLDTPAGPLVNDLFFVGASGVDLFFIISGFIMVYTTSRFDRSPAYALEFLVKRFARVWPVYAVVTLIWLVVAYNGLGYFRFPENLRTLGLSLLFQPVDLNAPPFFGNALPIGWTLNFEMYFYLVFAASLLFGRLRWLVLAGWILATVLGIPYLKRGLTFDVTTNFQFSLAYLNLMTSPIILEFLAGAAIGWCYLQPWFRLRSGAVCRHLVFLAVGIFVWYLYSGFGRFHGPRDWGMVAIALVFAIALASKTIVIAPPAWLVWLGSISYSLYLTHTTVFAFVAARVTAAGGNIHTWAHVLLGLVVAVPVAALAHHYLEDKLSRQVRRGLLAVVRRVMPQDRRTPAHAGTASDDAARGPAREA
jgi:peptidoglycan/LPS O-acetylase OafA/YrhL